MKIIKKYYKSMIIVVCVSASIISILFEGDFSIIVKAAAKTNPFLFIFCCLLPIVYYLLDGLTITIFGRLFKKDYSIKEGMVIALISPFFNGITPFASGGQVAQVYMLNKQKIGYQSGIGIMLMHFIIYQVVLVLYTLIILIFKFSYYSAHFSSLFYLGLLGFVINTVVITTLFIGAHSKMFQNFVINVVFRIGYALHIIKNYDLEVAKYQNKLMNFREDLDILLHNKKVIVYVLVLNVIRMTLNYMIPYFCFNALGIDLTKVHITEFIGITAFIQLITAFVPIPGASGGSEGVFVLMYGKILGKMNANYGMLIWRFATYYLMMVIGAIIFIIQNQTDNEVDTK